MTEQARLFEHLLLLGNQAMAADRIELGDFDGTQQTLRRTMGYLSLGLEFRLRAPPGTPAGELRDLQIDPQHAAQILREVPLLYLFRLGYSLTLQLRKLATLLVQSGLTTLVPKEDPASLLLSEQAAPLRALLELRPLYSLLLDPPKTARAPAGSSRPADDEGDAPRRREVRPFQSLRDLGRAAALIERLSAIDKLMTTGLGLRRDTIVPRRCTGKSPGPAAVKVDDLLGTMVSNLLLDRPPVLVPLPRRDLAQLRWRALGDAAAGHPRNGLRATTRGHRQGHVRPPGPGPGALAERSRDAPAVGPRHARFRSRCADPSGHRTGFVAADSHRRPVRLCSACSRSGLELKSLQIPNVEVCFESRL